MEETPMVPQVINYPLFRENPIDDVVEDLEELAKLSSPFDEPNVAFVIEERKLYVQKSQLVAVSPVFEAMFSDKFIEGSKEEIPLPGKNLNHFVRFLRYLCPGFNDELTDDTVHDMLPLADEYQTDDFKKKIEKFLVKGALTKSDSISSEQIILDILEAEMYKLSEYLKVSIAIASRKKFNSLTKSHKFGDISNKTQRRISFKRWEDIDKIFNKAVKVNPRFLMYQENKQRPVNVNAYGFVPNAPKQYEIDIKDVGEQLKPYMKEN